VYQQHACPARTRVDSGPAAPASLFTYPAQIMYQELQPAIIF